MDSNCIIDERAIIFDERNIVSHIDCVKIGRLAYFTARLACALHIPLRDAAAQLVSVARIVHGNVCRSSNGSGTE